MNRPITIDGTPVITSAMKRMNRGEPAAAAVLVEVDGAEDAERDGHRRGRAGDEERADDGRAHARPRATG